MWRTHPLKASAKPAALAFLLLACQLSACKRSVAPPKPYLAFVANNLDNSVAVVNLGTFRLVGTIPVAPAPIQVIARPRAQEIYAVSESGSVSVISFPGLRVTKVYHIGPSARGLVFSPDGKIAYLLDPAEGQIVSLDCAHGKELARLRAGPVNGLASLVLTPDGKTLIAAAGTSNQLVFVDRVNFKTLGTVTVGKGPGPMVILPDSSKVFVADTGEQAVSAVAIPFRAVLSNLELGYTPSSLALKPDGGEIFVLSVAGSNMTILDAYHDNVEENLTAGLGPAAAVMRRDSSVLYLATSGDGDVTAYSIDTRAVLAHVFVGGAPTALALTPGERFLAVALRGSSSLAILSALPTALLTTIPVGRRPVDVAIPGWISARQ